MKSKSLKSLQSFETINKETLHIITGGTSLVYNHTRGHDTLRNDSLKQDGADTLEPYGKLSI